MLTVQSTKICIMFAMFVATFILSMLPIKLLKAAQHSQAHRNRYKNALSILSCYAAGVFLATCLLDLFPAVHEKMEKAMDRIGVITSYPVAEFLLAFGFFLMLVVEQLVLAVKERQSDSEENAPLINGNVPKPTVVQSHHQVSINASGSYNADHLIQPEVFTESIEEEYHIVREDDLIPPQDKPYQDPASNSILRSVMLLLALSLHSIFEGLAVGLQDTQDAVIQIFTALIIHKSILAFSLGLNLVQSRMKLWAIIRGNIAFSLTSPIGIGIGIAVDHFTGPYSFASNCTNGVLQGLACGTFIYVVFFEILPHEFNSSSKQPNRLLKVLFLMLGFGTISLVMFVLPDEVVPKPIPPVNEQPGLLNMH